LPSLTIGLLKHSAELWGKLIPDIPLVVIDLMLAQEIDELVLEGPLSMVLLLIADVFEDFGRV
jgi:hypothetical protein